MSIRDWIRGQCFLVTLGVPLYVSILQEGRTQDLGPSLVYDQVAHFRIVLARDANMVPLCLCHCLTALCA